MNNLIKLILVLTVSFCAKHETNDGALLGLINNGNVGKTSQAGIEKPLSVNQSNTREVGPYNYNEEAWFRAGHSINKFQGLPDTVTSTSYNINLETEGYIKPNSVSLFLQDSVGKTYTFPLTYSEERAGKFSLNNATSKIYSYGGVVNIPNTIASGKAKIGVYHTINFSMFGFFQKGSFPLERISHAGKLVEIDVNSNTSSTRSITETDSLALKRGGYIVSNIQGLELDNRKQGKRIRLKYSIESYEEIDSMVGVYEPQSEINKTFSSIIVGTKSGNFSVNGLKSKIFEFESTIKMPYSSSVLIGFYNRPSKDSNTSWMFSTIHLNSWAGEFYGNKLLNLTLTPLDFYAGQANTQDQYNNCGPGVAKMICNTYSNCNASVDEIRNYIDSIYNSAGRYLTIDEVQSGINHFVGSDTNSIVSLASDATREDVVNELNNGNKLMVLVRMSEVAFRNSTSFPILGRYYTFNGNHFILIHGIKTYNGVDYFVVHDPHSWEYYIDNNQTNNGFFPDNIHQIPKGRSAWYPVTEVLRAMNHNDVKPGGRVKYLIVY
ncbi:MAG: C39 family peptidase [Leptospiraceae bacterium]|nr:C39 family peptidase [Leptospiraceae bacterium]